MDASIQQKISTIINTMTKQSDASSKNLPLYQMLTQFGPLLTDLKEFQNQIKSEDTMMIYLKYHQYIKQLESENGQVIKISQQSMDALSDPKKFQEIQQRVMKMMEQLQSLQKEALDKNQMVLLWIDKNKGNNDKELEEFQQNYNGKLFIQYLTDYNEFKKVIQQKKNSPAIVIMSAASAGSNTQYGDGDIFNYLKQSKKDLRIKGTIIYCGQAGYENLKGLKKDPSKLLTCITTDYDKMMEVVKSLIIPTYFNRIVPLIYLDYFLPNIKDKYVQKNIQDWSTYKLNDLKPGKVDYAAMFEAAFNLIQKQQIKFDPQVTAFMKNIPKEIQTIFDATNNESQLQDSFVKLYSIENAQAPVYKCLNSSLNILNEDLLNIMEKFIDLFFISFSKYDDSGETIIQSDGSQIMLYRGSTVSTESLDQYLKENSFVILPSFSSFSTDIKNAEWFVNLNNNFEGSVPAVFEYQYSTGTQGFSKRPKSISRVAAFPKEDEYVVYPFTCFKIQKMTPPTAQKDYYTIRLVIK